MAATPSIRVVKTFNFKGNGAFDWSNRYHFSGGTPANATQWETLMDNVVDPEATCYGSHVVMKEIFGYEAGSDVPVYSKTYGGAGTGSFGGNFPAGETVALVRWGTDQRSTKNHPIYLFNYYHGVKVGTAYNTCDELVDAQKAAFEDYCDLWLAGFSDGVHTLHRAGPRGAVAQDRRVETYVTHRDFPYTPSA